MSQGPNDLSAPAGKKVSSDPSADDLGAELLRRAVDLTVCCLTEDQRVVMRSHLESKPMPDRVRAVCDPGRIADWATDELWTILAREPSPDERLELAAVLRDAAMQIEGEANR